MEGLYKAMGEIVGRIDGRLGVSVRDIATGEEIGFRMDEPLPMASVCKVPILVAAYKRHEAGGLDLAERVPFTKSCRCFGSGLLNAFEPGLQPTWHDLLLMMIVVSDNAATDLALDRLTAEYVTETMHDLGLPDIHLNRPIRELIGDIFAALDPRLEGIRFGEWDAMKEKHPDLAEKERDLDEARRAVNAAVSDRDVATPRHIARLAAMLARNECAGEESCSAMLEILDKQQLNGRLNRDLPAHTRFPHKTGTLGYGAVVNDAGILYLRDEPVAAICVLSRDVRNPAWETNTALAGIGRAVYDYYKG